MLATTALFSVAGSISPLLRATFVPRHFGMSPLNVTPMRTAVAFLMATLLGVQSLQAQQPVPDNAIRQSVAALPPKAHVVIHLTDGDTLRGRIASRTDHDFILKPDNREAPRTISYDQVSAVEQIRDHSNKKWIIIGVVVAVVVVVVAVIAIHVKNEPL